MKFASGFGQRVLLAAFLTGGGMLLGEYVAISISVPVIAATAVGWIAKSLVDNHWRQLAFGLALLVGVFAASISLYLFAIAWGVLAIAIDAFAAPGADPTVVRR